MILFSKSVESGDRPGGGVEKTLCLTTWSGSGLKAGCVSDKVDRWIQDGYSLQDGYRETE